ncbi:hypothetical protein [Pantoea ananatis]|uniref:hypothetical protein n=1 Tax=Pantoea ananas TaxID=553 RepID=UPI003AFA554B
MPGSTHWPFLTRSRLSDLPPLTQNKRYVASSRARGHIWFMPETLLRSFRQQESPATDHNRINSRPASSASMVNRTPSWRVTSSAKTRVDHSVYFASLWPIRV